MFVQIPLSDGKIFSLFSLFFLHVHMWIWIEQTWTFGTHLMIKFLYGSKPFERFSSEWGVLENGQFLCVAFRVGIGELGCTERGADLIAFDAIHQSRTTAKQIFLFKNNDEISLRSAIILVIFHRIYASLRECLNRSDYHLSLDSESHLKNHRSISHLQDSIASRSCGIDLGIHSYLQSDRR